MITTKILVLAKNGEVEKDRKMITVTQKSAKGTEYTISITGTRISPVYTLILNGVEYGIYEIATSAAALKKYNTTGCVITTQVNCGKYITLPMSAENWQQIIDATPSIDGLAELEAVSQDWDRYRDGQTQRVERAMHAQKQQPNPKPIEKYSDVAARYPVAAAYLLAESWAHKSNYDYAIAGQNAMRAIESGQNHEQAITDMRAAINAVTLD